jgi:hypothetical protein
MGEFGNTAASRRAGGARADSAAIDTAATR